MKIDAINFGAFTNTSQIQSVALDETDTSSDEFDDTRVAIRPMSEKPVSAPIEKSNGTIEDLMSMQASTEKMAHSYGFTSVEQASSVTSNTTETSGSASVSGVSSMTLNA